jgi:hypothetical protein
VRCKIHMCSSENIQTVSTAPVRLRSAVDGLVSSPSLAGDLAPCRFKDGLSRLSPLPLVSRGAAFSRRSYSSTVRPTGQYEVV